MFIPRIYYPHPLFVGELTVLESEMAHYLIKVLRLKEGEQIILFNGQGGEFSATVHIIKKSAQANIIAFHDINTNSMLKLHLGQGLCRGDRMDFAIQKATELGVCSITPLVTENCLVKLAEGKSEKRIQHWKNIAISASEQSGRTDVPHIYPAISLTEWVKQSFEGLSIVFDLKNSHPLKQVNPTPQIRLAIGPESGLKEREVNWMISQGFTACHLGPRVLRTETAGMTALSILQGLFGDLSIPIALNE